MALLHQLRSHAAEAVRGRRARNLGVCGAFRQEQKLADVWFRSHFAHAADEIASWLGQAKVDLRSARILDFGCGDGVTALGVARRHVPCELVGVDLHSAFSQLATKAAHQINLALLPDNLHFARIEPGQPVAALGPFDCIYSWSVFEHIDCDLLPNVMADMYASLRPGGVFLIQIEPLFYSPFGSHLNGLLPRPWGHLATSSEELVRSVERASRDDVLPKHRDQAFESLSFPDYKEFLLREFRSLNRITPARLASMANRAGFIIEKSATKRLPQLVHLALLTQQPRLLSLYSLQSLVTSEMRLLLRRP